MSAALLFMLVVGMVMFASMALLPPMLQQLFGYTVLDTGLLLAPRGFGGTQNASPAATFVRARGSASG